MCEIDVFSLGNSTFFDFCILNYLNQDNEKIVITQLTNKN